ncbi:MAG TPA: DUF6569 family protein, partial [Vicinamibacterales bacterium]|nr:DUF6569 family protein [Vicinamibacterales bacterium]
MQTSIARALSSVTLGHPVSFDNLTMFPLVGPGPVDQAPWYLTLDEAMALEWTEITEVSAEGRVPELRVVNRGPQPVFMLDGEELLGAKQNRVVNLTILVPAESELTIPVSCVEVGRWRVRSRAFTSAPRTQYAAGRAKRMSQVSRSMQMKRGRMSNQAEVWADISEKSSRLGADSPTGAMEEMFSRHADFTERCVETLRPVDRQCGALFLISGQVAGFDLFDRAVTLRRLLPKLVRSAAVDALDGASRRSDIHGGRDGDGELVASGSDARSAALQGCHRDPAARESALQFLAAVRAFVPHVSPALGLGEDHRLVAPHVAGAALIHDEQAIHVSAFTL